MNLQNSIFSVAAEFALNCTHIFIVILSSCHLSKKNYYYRCEPYHIELRNSKLFLFSLFLLNYWMLLLLLLFISLVYIFYVSLAITLFILFQIGIMRKARISTHVKRDPCSTKASTVQCKARISTHVKRNPRKPIETATQRKDCVEGDPIIKIEFDDFGNEIERVILYPEAETSSK